MSEHIKKDWMINGLLAVILALLVGFYLNVSKKVFAAPTGGGGWETNGIMAMTSGTNERLILVDTAKQNIMLYKPQAGSLFRLVGARSYQYDVEIEDSDNVESMKHGGGITFAQAKQLYEAVHPPVKP